MPEDLPEAERRVYADPAPKMPRYLILDLQEETVQFLDGITQMQELGIDVPTAVAEVIDTIQKEADAPYEVAYTAYEMLPPEGDSVLNQEMIEYLRLRDEFATALIRKLQLLKIYLNGMLFYQLKHIEKTALVLEKLEIPMTRHDRSLRVDARQADLANRQRLQGLAPDFAKVLRQPQQAGGVLRPSHQVPGEPAMVLRARRVP